MTSRDALLAELRRLQREAGATDGEYAEALGCSRAGWNHIRLGTRKMGPRVIQQARRLFPDLRDLCIAALMEMGDDCAA